MRNVLVLDSSADPVKSVSRELTALFIETWKASRGADGLVYRDLHRSAPPHLPHPALHWAPEERDPSVELPAEAVELQNELLDELIAADGLVVAAPMYNWSIPSPLKAWIDYVHVMGVTTPLHTNTQPLAGRRALIISSRGDQYGPGTPNPHDDHAVPPVEKLLDEAFGMDVEVITADLTLAPVLDELADFAPQFAENMAAARAAVVATATNWAE